MLKSNRTSSRPAHHANNSGTAFINPWPSADKPTWTELLQGQFPLGFYKSDLHKHDKAHNVQVVKPDWGIASLQKQALDKTQCVIGTWLGHASSLVEIPSSDKDAHRGKSVYLLFDPIFSDKAGPPYGGGVTRMKKPPCRVEELPGVNALFISHNHYDHLDEGSVRSVVKMFPHVVYFVPLGVKKWFVSVGVVADKVVELDWEESREFCIDGSGLGSVRVPGGDDETTLKVSCVPAQHNSARSPLEVI